MKIPNPLSACLRPTEKSDVAASGTSETARSEPQGRRASGLLGGLAPRLRGRSTNPPARHNVSAVSQPPSVAAEDALPLQKGMVIKGLATLLDGGGVVGADNGELHRGVSGSYTVTGNEVVFHANQSGQHKINVLPYVAGAISYARMQGQTTVSGPFTGCTMGIYNAQGETRVNHVDTAEASEGEAPSKLRWERMKRQGLEIADELSTKGMLGHFLDSATPDPSFATLSVLAVASPVAGIRHHYVVKQDGHYLVVG
ncbi:hypothetical protein [Ralstonia chuxiongensis]|uniref:hypothetical protein n=1 Tax=Ralstonia chuxiongensis TaxID=2957504 RepID=UPI0029313469|nr:hypothetical protein [Ralstonia chuxiongensis]